MRLMGKTALITGAAMGIGEAIAMGMAREGADVIVADINPERAVEVVGEIEALGRKATFVETDVTKKTETDQMVKKALKESGKIDALVNCAGGTARERAALFHESSEEVWDYVINLNLKGVFNCCRSVVEHMMEGRSGKIVNIASVAGIVGYTGLVDYSAAKAGVIGLTKALAKELIPYGINVNCVSPAGTATRAMDVYSEEVLAARKRATGFGRLSEPEDIANMVVYLASEEAKFIAGQNIAVCGIANLGV
jgi:3-oxoacyl-[acyl-carrier protein] reductase